MQAMTKRSVDRKAIILESEVAVLRKYLDQPKDSASGAKRARKVERVLARLDEAFAAYEPAKVAQAEAEFHRDGEVEIDEGAVCSRSEEGLGCYVQAWVWCYD
jgi:hypothetical protein